MDSNNKEEVIKEALKKAREEGFRDAKLWEESELLSWYKALLKHEGKKIPLFLRRYKDTTS